MFTILQRNKDLSYTSIAKYKDIETARDRACDLCNEAGVIRTIVVNEWGDIVSIES